MPEIESLIANFPEKLGILFEPARYKVIYGGRGGGRSVAVGTEIMMADGTLRKVENIDTGDSVMGIDSKPRRVMSTSRGMSQMYRVHQTSADDYVVNEHHILSLKKATSCANDRGGKMPSGNWRRSRGRYPNYPDVCNTPIKEVIQKSDKWKYLFRGYKAGLINFPAKEVGIDAWLLGQWLGDGTARELRITTQSQEVIDECKKCAKEYGGDISVCKKDENTHDIGFRIRNGNKNPLWQEFLNYNLKNNKHIPQDYLINSEEVRLNVLAGFIDSDGYTNHNTYYITQVQENLARELKQLADSLGFRTSLKRVEKFDKPHYTNGHLVRGGNRIIWKVSISGNAYRIPCRIGYKRLLEKDVNPNKDFLLSQVEIEPIGEGEYAGIGVEGDHLYLLADGTVTHNSWGCARALLLKAIARPLRVLCAREVQQSIRDSVHKLLGDQIRLLGLGEHFEILEKSIRVKNGGEFTFSGLSTQTVESIKSMEGVDIVWCEESHVITKRSWDILIPTIRKDDSEIWVTFNPSLETDETYTRFVLNPPPDTLGIKLNYNDNPWFPEVLEKERLYCQESNPDDYPNIWEGDCKPAVEGAIYFKELQQIEKDKRILNIPYDPFLKVHIVPDLGAGDSLFVAMVQKSLSEIRIINTIVGTHFDYNTLSAELRELRYNWGKIWLPHDGYSKRMEAGGRSSYQILTKLGWDVAKREEIIELSIEEGIRNARMVFPRVYFDKEKTVDLIESLKRYRRRINRETHTATTPMHDDASHGADCFRYICANEGNFLNADDKPKFEYHAGYSPLDATIGY